MNNRDMPAMTEQAEENTATPNVYNGSLFDYTASGAVGVLITEPVMKKLAKLQADHMHKVKQLLSNEADNGNVFPSMWTLHYPNGKQTAVKFIDISSDVSERINWATNPSKPKHEPLVFIADSMKSAAAQADALLAELEKGQ